MTKFLFWFFLIVNVVLFITIQRGYQWWTEPVITQPALHEDRMRVLTAAQIESDNKLIASDALSSVTSTTVSTTKNLNLLPIEKPSESICLEWGEFLDVELNQVKSALETLGLGKKLEKRQVEHTIGYWVYIPPLKDKAAINKKVLQLKADGISEYFIVLEPGIWKNAISLGVFKTQEAAQNFLNSLRNKKIRSAQVGKRNSKLKLSIFVLNKIDASTEAHINLLQKDFPGSELKIVSCESGLTR